MSAKAILSHYKVVDCTVAMAGPFATQRLGDLGADVIKVEPVTGEWQRFASAGGAGRTGINASFLSLNRNKRSLAVNLKTPEGRKIVQQLAASADVFVQNYRNGVAERLGVDYATLSKLNPRLIYVSISGYGATGPYASLPGQDLLLQGLSGSMFSTGNVDDEPVPSGMFVADATTAYCAFEGVLAALLYRERTGEGQLVEVNMLDAMIALQMQEISVTTIGGRSQIRTEENHAHVHIRAPYAVFRTLDSFMIVSMPPLAVLAEVIGEPALAQFQEERDGFPERDSIHRLTSAKLAERTTAEWIAVMRERDIWCGPVHDFEAMLQDPQVLHNGSMVEYDHHTEGRLRTPGFPIRFEKTPASIERGAPLVGEHSREILAEIGYSSEQIQSFLVGDTIAETVIPSATATRA
ncbi:crotonobetainyl-CoA:carnitine CoA-transferase CaiB-like acyl-CoA transferase [Devosia sp. UYZn731]|uniref:CaiB/BaiF CoA transferase family protein n=1 Tax=Devosia sp. UYZn731 TaxID=3156345 RepID=UPI0033980099